MPNWCEGSLKLRGNSENILRFFKEGLMSYMDERINTLSKEYDNYLIDAKTKRNRIKWYYRMAKRNSRMERKCLRRAKFYGYFAHKFIDSNPDGIWRYVMVMYDNWMACSEVWGEMAEKALRKYKELITEESDEEQKE